MDLSQPIVMGILNVTPDSFYDGGSFFSLDKAVEQAMQMVDEGASILDIGGQSTRPGATKLSAEEELDRVLPVVERLTKVLPPKVWISVDTFYASVAFATINSGAHMINDISGGTIDKQLWPTVASLKVPYVLMHMRGTPETMAKMNQYQDLVPEVIQDLQQKAAAANNVGIQDLILDPGFGFAKNPKQNFELLRELKAFKMVHLPIVVGISRKSMIWKTLGTSPEEALNGTTVLNTIALLHGAQILRVHDVKEAMETVKLINELESN